MKDTKLKGLRPTLRVKKRFLKVQIHSSNSSLLLKDIIFALNSHLLKTLGTLFYAEFGVWIIKEKCDEKEKYIIIKSTPKGVEYVKTALILGFCVKQDECRAQILNISGTLKGLQKNTKQKV